MREAARVEDQEGDCLAARALDALDEFVLGVALEGAQLMAALTGDGSGTLLDRFQGIAAIDGRFAAAEQIEVRAVQ